MPIIFAQAIMFVPSILGGTEMLKRYWMLELWLQAEFSDIFGLTGTILFSLY